MEIEYSTPIRTRRDVIASRVAPCSVLAAKPIGEIYTAAELEQARQRIAERDAKRAASMPAPKLAPVDPAPQPIVPLLPVPICTFIFDTNRRRTDWDAEDCAA